jgi:hypothetical protein
MKLIKLMNQERKEKNEKESVHYSITIDFGAMSQSYR